MEQLYLTRRNLLTLLSKLDRAARGEDTERTLIKRDTVHPKYPCSTVIQVTAVEDEDYYIDRVPGPVHQKDTGDLGRGTATVYGWIDLPQELTVAELQGLLARLNPRTRLALSGELGAEIVESKLRVPTQTRPAHRP